jgi:chromosome segregation ATPase
LVNEARQVFLETRDETESWLRMALNPLNAALKEHETQLNMRVENLRKLQGNLGATANRGKELERELAALKEQHAALVKIMQNMGGTSQQPADCASLAVTQPANDSMAAPGARAA